MRGEAECVLSYAWAFVCTILALLHPRVSLSLLPHILLHRSLVLLALPLSPQLSPSEAYIRPTASIPRPPLSLTSTLHPLPSPLAICH